MAIYDKTHGGYRIFIGDIGSRVGKHELEKEMEYYGSLVDVWVASKTYQPARYDRIHRNPPGFAFVVYKYSEDADKVVRDLDGRTLCGRRVRVAHARPYEQRRRTSALPWRSPRSDDRSRSRSRSHRSRSKSRDRRRSRSRSWPRRSRSRSRSREWQNGRRSSSKRSLSGSDEEKTSLSQSPLTKATTMVNDIPKESKNTTVLRAAAAEDTDTTEVQSPQVQKEGTPSKETSGAVETEDSTVKENGTVKESTEEAAAATASTE